MSSLDYANELTHEDVLFHSEVWKKHRKIYARWFYFNTMDDEKPVLQIRRFRPWTSSDWTIKDIRTNGRVRIGIATDKDNNVWGSWIVETSSRISKFIVHEIAIHPESFPENAMEEIHSFMKHEVRKCQPLSQDPKQIIYRYQEEDYEFRGWAKTNLADAVPYDKEIDPSFLFLRETVR